MIRRLSILVAVVLAASATDAYADAGTEPSASAAPTAPASPSGSANVMPAGHPPVDAEDPHGGGAAPKRRQLPQDDSREEPSLPAGTIVVRIHDIDGRPIANEPVTLGILRTSVPEGEARSRSLATTDAQGVARFDGLKTGSGWAYRASITAAAPEDPNALATYGSDPFQIPLDKGWEVLVHKFAVTTSLDGLLAAVEGVDTIVELRDDVIEVSQLFDVINASETTWSLGGGGLVLALPKGAKALRTPDSMGDQKVVLLEGTGAKWTGSFAPGRSRITYDYKLPYDGESEVSAEIGLPPRVLAARVRLPSRKGMSLDVSGFPPAREEPTATGVKVFSTVKQVSPDAPLTSLSIRISGIPTTGNDRWMATGAALAALAVGLWFAFRPPAKSDRATLDAARARLRRAIMDELELLARAHRSGEVGPKAYARERQKLIDRLADALDPDEHDEPAGTPARHR
jgi:hypothetical protein